MSLQHNVQLPQAASEETIAQVLNMLAGPPSPSYLLATQLQAAAGVAGNIRKLVGAVSAGFLAMFCGMWYVFGAVHHIDDNTRIAGRFAAKEYAYDGVVKQWETFTQGPSCDLARLRQMEMQQDLGLTNAEMKHQNILPPAVPYPAPPAPAPLPSPKP